MLLAIDFVSTLRAYEYTETNPNYANLRGIILSQMSDFAHDIEDAGGYWEMVELAYESLPTPSNS